MALSSLAVFAADAPEQEVRLLVDLVRLSRITVLYAETGADKSAVVRSSVLPLLRAQAGGPRRDVAVLLDDWVGAPLPKLIARLEAAIATVTGRNVPAGVAVPRTLAQNLAEWQETFGVNFIIVFDRVEELLAAGDRADLQQFEDEWIEAVNAKALRANFLLSLDEDAAHGLERLRSRVPALGDARVRLPAPKRPGAAPQREEAAGLLTGSERRAETLAKPGAETFAEPRAETLAERLERLRAEYAAQSRPATGTARESAGKPDVVAYPVRREPRLAAPPAGDAPAAVAPGLQQPAAAAVGSGGSVHAATTSRRTRGPQKPSLIKVRAGIALAALLIVVAYLLLFKTHTPVERAQEQAQSTQTVQPEQQATQQVPDSAPQVNIAELATDELPLRSEAEYAAADPAQQARSGPQEMASTPAVASASRGESTPRGESAPRAASAAPSAAAPSGPLLYIHVRDESQRARAQRMIKPLATRGIRVSGIKVVSFGPKVSDLRYFRAAERDEAQKVGRVLRDIGVPPRELKFVAGFEGQATQRQYELWLPPEGRGG